MMRSRDEPARVWQLCLSNNLKLPYVLIWSYVSVKLFASGMDVSSNGGSESSDDRITSESTTVGHGQANVVVKLLSKYGPRGRSIQLI